tara:strand:+ start:228 stop:647 length:420 start_codon:yes stop_codon:yes gene_type:complete
MTWFNIIKNARGQLYADIIDEENGLGILISKGLTRWMNDNEVDSIEELTDVPTPIYVTKTASVGIYADAEDDFYIQIYIKGRWHKGSGPQPIGTFLWETQQFNLDERLADEIDGRTLRGLIPTSKQRDNRDERRGTGLR